MANHKSAKKRIRQNEKRRIRNRYWRTSMRTSIKKVRAAVGTGNLDEARTNLQKAVRLIGKVRSKGIIHRNQASRRISRLTRFVNQAGDGQA